MCFAWPEQMPSLISHPIANDLVYRAVDLVHDAFVMARKGAFVIRAAYLATKRKFCETIN